MNIASKTPEGSPNYCSVCSNEVNVEPSTFPTNDAPCPICGSLLFFNDSIIQEKLAELRSNRLENFYPNNSGHEYFEHVQKTIWSILSIAASIAIWLIGEGQAASLMTFFCVFILGIFVIPSTYRQLKKRIQIDDFRWFAFMTLHSFILLLPVIVSLEYFSSRILDEIFWNQDNEPFRRVSAFLLAIASMSILFFCTKLICRSALCVTRPNLIQ